jgi:hypothetical protein
MALPLIGIAKGISLFPLMVVRAGAVQTEEQAGNRTVHIVHPVVAVYQGREAPGVFRYGGNEVVQPDKPPFYGSVQAKIGSLCQLVTTFTLSQKIVEIKLVIDLSNGSEAFR